METRTLNSLPLAAYHDGAVRCFLAIELQIPIHRGQSFRRIADSVPVIADSFR